ncbi:Ferritin-like protein [Gracilaria domingensis]|nr:Ferritin-like protein [Gracilaria domingensis]
MQAMSQAYAATTVSSYASRVLTAEAPMDKVRLTQAAVSCWEKMRASGPGSPPPNRPSRPKLPLIIPPSEIPGVKQSKAPANVYHLHSLAHVELNAIDLCFDTMLRFESGIPTKDRDDWFEDWLSIASDEARHFSYLHDRLISLGSFYGALPAHDIIWKSADVSRGCLHERLALGQLVAEAKGLDAGPKLVERLVGFGDNKSAAVVRQIADEEIRHVKLGVKWFLKECDRLQLDSIKTFHSIAIRLANPGAFARPFNEERRLEAGMTPEWYLPVAEEVERQRRERAAVKRKYVA